MSQFSRCLALSVAGVLALPLGANVFAQTLSPQGGEYVWPDLRPGDQVFPKVDLSITGGWAVWIDNALTPTGPGVAATRLSQNGQAQGDIYVVSEEASDRGAGDRRRGGRRNRRPPGPPPSPPNVSEADVVALPNGGAAVTWQVGPQGNSEAFVRFYDVDGPSSAGPISLTPDIQESSETVTVEKLSWMRNRLRNRRWRIRTESFYERDRTLHPHAAVLSDGSVAVVYSGVRRSQTNSYEIVTEVTARTRRGAVSFTTNDVLHPVSSTFESKQDIFVRFFDNQQQPVGEEILINQFTDNHQRSPKVVSLGDNRMIVIWVSEDYLPVLPTETPELGIHGRMFDNSGTPLGDEFQINDKAGVCARPVVAAAAGGGFVVAWNQRDEIANNSWDIQARVFDAEGQPLGEAVLVNERTYGDQFAPAMAGLGHNQFLVWNSMGQDGSHEGVYGRLMSAGHLTGSEFRINGATDGKQVHPDVTSDGQDGFMVVWSHFTGVTSFDLMGRLYGTTQPWPAPAAPSVTPLGSDSLQVAWEAVGAIGLLGYELYVDGAAHPIMVAGTTYEVTGLEPDSEHVFRLAYVIQGGGRSVLSEAVTGTTLSLPGSIVEPSAEDAGTLVTLPPTGPWLAGETIAPLHLKTAVRDGRLVVAWATTAGKSYQLQISYSFNQWFDLGDPRRASGDTDAVELSLKERAAFFRVLEMP